MSYLLQFPAATAYVVTGRLILGASYSISFELQRDSDVDIYLSSDGGDELRFIVGAGWQIRFGGGYFSYPEAELIPPIGEKFTVTFARDGSTSNRSVQLNGGTPVSKVTSAVNLWFNNIGQGFGGVYRAFKLYKCTITNPSNTTYNRVFDADASGGTGTILPNTLTGTNNGTLTGAGWPSDDSEWIFYSSGSAYSDTLSGTTFTSSISSLTSTRAKADTLSGASYSSSVGNLAATRGYASTLSGISLTSSIGSLSATRGYSSVLNASTYSSSIGELTSTTTSASGYDSLLAGLAYTSSLGAMLSTVQRASVLNGIAFNSSLGSMAATLGYNSALSGAVYSSSIGALISTRSGEVTVTIEGYTIKFADSAIAAAYANNGISAGYAADILEITWQH